MICSIAHPKSPQLALGQVHVGELFLVPGIAALRHAVCTVSLLVEQPAHALTSMDAVTEACQFFVRTAIDTKRAIVVVGCTAREGQAGYLPSGTEIDIDNRTAVTLVQQTEPLALRVVEPRPYRGGVKVEQTIGVDGVEPLSTDCRL